MKKTIAILLVLTASSIFSQSSGWFWQNPLPQGHYIGSAKFVNSMIGFAVGDCGTVLKTTNGGMNWNFVKGLDVIRRGEVFPVNENICYVIGGYNNVYPDKGLILKTSNGGDNWVYLRYDSSKLFNNIYFVDQNTGYCSGYNGI